MMFSDGIIFPACS